jgi:hypothetical protein
MLLQELARLGIDVVTVPRGGETTYHGPGQLVAYPILNLRQLGLGARAFVEGLEDAMVQTVGCFGIQVGHWWDRLAVPGNARLARCCVPAWHWCGLWCSPHARLALATGPAHTLLGVPAWHLGWVAFAAYQLACHIQKYAVWFLGTGLIML